MAVFFGESFDCGFAIDHGGDDLALFGGLLGTDHDVVAVADRKINHRITDDFEQEKLALAY